MLIIERIHTCMIHMIIHISLCVLDTWFTYIYMSHAHTHTHGGCSENCGTLKPLVSLLIIDII